MRVDWTENALTIHMFQVDFSRPLFKTTHEHLMFYSQASEMGFQMLSDQEDKSR